MGPDLRRDDGLEMRLINSILLFIFLTSSAQAEILIGVAGPLTGTYASFGAQMVQGAQAAVDRLNAEGGIEGELVELVSVDDGCDSRQAELVAEQLVLKKVRVVVGHYCSNPSLAAAKIYEAAGITMITPSASLPALTDAGLANVIRLVGRDDAQGVAAALDISADAIMALIDDGSAANVALASRFKQARKTPVALAVSIKPDTKEFDALISEIGSKRITAIYLACSASDAGRIARALQAANVKADLFGPDSLLADQYWEIAGDAAEGTRVTFATDPQSAPEGKRVIAELKAQNIDGGGPTLGAYAAVQLFAATPKNTASDLRSGRQFKTVLGDLAFDAKGDVQPLRFVWYVWSKGKYSTVYSEN